MAHGGLVFGGEQVFTGLSPHHLLASKEIHMSKFITKFVNDESGATAIEYGLIVALIAVVIVTAVTTLGGKLNGAFTTVASKIP